MVNYSIRSCITYKRALFYIKNNYKKEMNSILTEILFTKNNIDNTLHNLIINNNLDDIIHLQNPFKKDEFKTLLFSKNHLGDYPIHCAIWKENIEIIDSLLTQPEILSLQDSKLRTPLMLAIKTQNKIIIEKIIHVSHDKDLNLQDYHGNTALHYAEKMNDIHTFKLLLKSGANSEITNQHLKKAKLPEVLKEEASLSSLIKKYKF